MPNSLVIRYSPPWYQSKWARRSPLPRGTRRRRARTPAAKRGVQREAQQPRGGQDLIDQRDPALGLKHGVAHRLAVRDLPYASANIATAVTDMDERLLTRANGCGSADRDHPSPDACTWPVSSSFRHAGSPAIARQNGLPAGQSLPFLGVRVTQRSPDSRCSRRTLSDPAAEEEIPGWLQRTGKTMGGGGELREGYAEVGDQRLHYVEAGEGPLVILLHGFPEFWFGWRLQIQPLAAAGFRVVAPDMRGYNLSSKPNGVHAYDTDKLTGDIRGLIHKRGAESALLVGHDWGGTVAWDTAMSHPEVVERLAILNVAHPRQFLRGLHHPGQLRRSWYVFSSTCRSCPKPSCTLMTGTSSGTSFATPARLTRRRSSNATSRRGLSRTQRPG